MQWFRLSMSDEALNEQLDLAREQLKERRAQLDERFEDKKKKLQTGDDMAPGVLKIVKVYLAIKRRIQPGDKMAGRHGNKGVISIIMPVEDMPYDEEGNPVDIVLNPLGVPSRMNVGQVLETHLGAAARGLGHKINRMIESQKKVAEIRDFLDQVYNGVGGGTSLRKVWIKFSDEEVMELAKNLRGGVPMATLLYLTVPKKSEVKELDLRLADISDTGQVAFHDGRTGDAFDRPVTVGYMYMLEAEPLG